EAAEPAAREDVARRIDAHRGARIEARARSVEELAPKLRAGRSVQFDDFIIRADGIVDVPALAREDRVPACIEGERAGLRAAGLSGPAILVRPHLGACRAMELSRCEDPVDAPDGEHVSGAIERDPVSDLLLAAADKHLLPPQLDAGSPEELDDKHVVLQAGAPELPDLAARSHVACGIDRYAERGVVTVRVSVGVVAPHLCAGRTIELHDGELESARRRPGAAGRDHVPAAVDDEALRDRLRAVAVVARCAGAREAVSPPLRAGRRGALGHHT